MINDFKQYFLSYGEPVYENPSPGNKAGGITTLEDKSLGCTQNQEALLSLMCYNMAKIRKPGLSLLQAPGNDLSCLCSCFIRLPVGLVYHRKRDSVWLICPNGQGIYEYNSFERKGHWMDFNAGVLLEQPMEVILESFVQKSSL